MAARSILVVEDDAAIRRGVVDALKVHGYRVMEAADGREGMDLALRRDYDLLLLDLVLPGPGGLEILEALKAGRPAQPVIILTAMGDESDRVKGLGLGADDYVVKPFSVRELLARVEAVLRRSANRPMERTRLAWSGVEVELDSGRVTFADGQEESLSGRESELLRYLALRPAQIVSRDELLLRVWRVSPNRVDTRTVDVHMARLRAKLHEDPDAPQRLFTVRGKGYMYREGGE